ncbi:MAG: DUF1345 domain-containing protein [Burkholderiaceae bacterium]
MKIRALKRFYIARPRLIYAFALGVVAAFVIPLPDNDWLQHTLIGWNVATYFYLAFIWITMARADEADVRGFAERQDESAYAVLTAVSLAAMMSLAAIVLELATADKGALHNPFHIALTAATVIGSWFLIPTIFTLHYAHFYYLIDAGNPPPLIFPEKGLKPDYWDFLYFSFTIAVASQTAEIAPGARSMRKAVLAQAVLSFFFNASILALSINIGASLVSSS